MTEGHVTTMHDTSGAKKHRQDAPFILVTAVSASAAAADDDDDAAVVSCIPRLVTKRTRAFPPGGVWEGDYQSQE